MVYKIVTAFSPWIMSNNLLTDVVRIREEILPRFKTMWCWIIRRRNSSIGSRKSRHRAAYNTTTYPSTPDTAAPGAGAARIRRIEPEIEAGEEMYSDASWIKQTLCPYGQEKYIRAPGYIQILLALPMIIARRCRTKTQQQWQVNLSFLFSINHSWLCLPYGRKETCLNTLRLIMNSQSSWTFAPRASPRPAGLTLARAVVSRVRGWGERDWLIWASVAQGGAADHQCWL